MFTVRPVWKRFTLWILLAPIWLIEAPALYGIQNNLALQDPAQTRQALAQVTEQRKGKNGGIEIRYRFQVPGGSQWYTASDTLGRRDLWKSVVPGALQSTDSNGQIAVVYLIKNPWANQPQGKSGNPVADSFCLWGWIFVFDAYWLFEAYRIMRQYLRCRAAAEERRECFLWYWQTRAI